MIAIEHGRITRLDSGCNRSRNPGRSSGRNGGRSSGRNAGADDLGDVAVIPGLVNAHTHLEFSDFTQPVTPACPFPDWIRAVIAARRQRSGSTQRAIDEGLRESLGSGTTLVGEIATDDVSARRFGAASPAGVVFREVLGIGDEAAAQQLALARQHLSEQTNQPDAAVLRGLSPHAPYSVSAELFQQCVQLAVTMNAPVAMHLAETREERELLRSGTGPSAELLKHLGVWRDRFWMRDGTIQSYLDVLAQAPRALIVHGNDLTVSEIEFLGQHPQMTVVFCPRTHHFFGHEAHPWQELLKRGVSVALGTDSRASNPDLSLWAEVQFLRRHFSDVPAETLLELATVRGAIALGQEDETGTLSPGKSADLAVVTFCEDARKAMSTHPTEALLHPGNRVTATMRRGRWMGRN